MIEESKAKVETAGSIGLVTTSGSGKGGQSVAQVKEYLDELEFLPATAEIPHPEAFHPTTAPTGWAHLTWAAASSPK